MNGFCVDSHQPLVHQIATNLGCFWRPFALAGPQFHCSLSSACTIMCNLHRLGHHTTQGWRTLPETPWLRFETTIMDCSVFAVHTTVFFFSHKNVMVWLQREKMFKCFPTVDHGSIKLVYLAMYSVWIFDLKFFSLSYWLEFHFQKKRKTKRHSACLNLGLEPNLTISEVAPNILLPFCSMYLCKAPFSSLIIDFKIKILLNSERCWIWSISYSINNSAKI